MMCTLTSSQTRYGKRGDRGGYWFPLTLQCNRPQDYGDGRRWTGRWRLFACLPPPPTPSPPWVCVVLFPRCCGLCCILVHFYFLFSDLAQCEVPLFLNFTLPCFLLLPTHFHKVSLSSFSLSCILFPLTYSLKCSCIFFFTRTHHIPPPLPLCIPFSHCLKAQICYGRFGVYRFPQLCCRIDPLLISLRWSASWYTLEEFSCCMLLVSGFFLWE